MMKRIAATEKTRERLRALIDGRLGTGADRSDLVRLAVQLIIEEVRKRATSLGANVTSALRARPLAIATATGQAG